MKNNYFKRMVLTVLLCSFFSMSYAADWYISTTGNDITGDGSMGNPWASFSKAQTSAASGDVINVSGMIDMWSDPANTTFTQISATPTYSTTNKTGIVIAKSLTIQGTSPATDGFNGTNGSNTTRFFQLTNAAYTLTLKNLKLSNGAIISPYATLAYAGGAIYVSNGNIMAENVVFDGNTVSGHTAITGAAICVQGSSNAGTYFKNCTFSNNKADKAGAIYIQTWAAGVSGTPSIFQFENCAFVANEAKNTGGSALYIRSSNEYTTFNAINCTFSKNKVTSSSNGGTINLGGKGMRYLNVNIINCTVTENTTTGSTTNGAGLSYVNTANNNIGNLYIKNSIFENNTASGAPSGFSDLIVSALSPTVPETGLNGTPPAGTSGYIKIENSIIGVVPATSVAFIPNGNIVSSQFNTQVGSNLTGKLGAFNTTTNSYPLTAASAALDLGSSALLSPVTTDQLGVTRPFTGGLCSAGAVEFLATAGQKIWKGITSTDPTVGTNWFPGGVPATTDFITIPTGKTNYPLYAGGLTLNGGLLESGAKLTVTDALVNNGTLTIENNANLIQVNNVANSGSGSTLVKRNSNGLFRLDYTMWSSPVSGSQTLAQFSPLTSQSPNRFFKYDSASELYANVATSNTFATGTGYLIRMPNEDPSNLGGGSTYALGTAPLTYSGEFTGLPNNGTINVATVANKYNGVGNPYPSVIDAELFQTSNPDINTLYFWRKTNNLNQGTSPTTSYATYNIMTTTGTGVAPDGAAIAQPTITPDKYIQVGQGFLFTTAQSSVVFNNAMRVANNGNKILKTKVVERNRIWLNLSNSKWPINQMALCYMNGATQGLDDADSKYFNDSQTALTSLINNEEFVIQGRPAFDAGDVVPLAFKTTASGDYTIALDHFDGVFATGQDVYLVDSKTGAETNLKEGGYNFTAVAGVDNARFSLKYQKTLKVDAGAFNDNSVVVYKNKGTLYVNSTAKAINNIQVYDVQGRLIAEQKNVETNTATINNLKANNQVLIVKISAEDNSVVTKKIVN